MQTKASTALLVKHYLAVLGESIRKRSRRMRLQIKTGLVTEIRRATRRLNLTQQQADTRMGLMQPIASRMMRNGFPNLSECWLMYRLARLDHDIEIEAK